jgi:hypothetical protein
MKNKWSLTNTKHMKNKITWSLNLIILTFLFSACSQKLGLTKRHYNKGYYAESKKRVNTVSINKNSESDFENNSKIMSSVLNGTLTNKSNLFVGEKSRVAKTFEELRIRPLEKINSNTKKRSLVIRKSVSQKINDLTFRPITFDLKNNLLTSSNENSEDGLSLFWIVILILLLLWLFGYIILSGGLINLVLALALVLLILWLLRII